MTYSQWWRLTHVVFGVLAASLLLVARAEAEADAALAAEQHQAAGSLSASAHSSSSSAPASQWDVLWHFMLNLATYASLLAPAYFAVRWLKATPHVMYGTAIWSKLVRSCVLGIEATPSDVSSSLEEGAGSSVGTSADALRSSRIAALKKFEDSIPRSARLTICALGLQISYVTWGVLQERIMTRSYGGGDAEGSDGREERFTNSQFLVLVNRLLAFVVACAAVAVIPHPPHATPLYKYSFCSISNVLSSWCQYEALKFVSFPTQVVFKSCKVIPVMLMGKVVSRRSYAWYEYGIAVLISVGVSIFLLADTGGMGRAGKAAAATTFAGVVILSGYLTFDSFTSNWQKNLFDTYKISPLQMMMGVNLFSCLFTLASLLQQGQLMPALAFLQRHPEAMYNITLLSVFSAIGQLFIYYTVRTFGPLTFTIIMTTRQLISIIISCLLYSHVITFGSMFGAFVAFSAVFSQAYIKSRSGAPLARKKPTQGDAQSSSPSAAKSAASI
ncbi:adenosine 3'-phospho 5'-phosphosulfate transporter 1-like [Sycon ciliatum]|uniref:adenosine 3'-phospho 5'-phosphosulfate transporter 1-like n=1 Tax=Sycon ciliatum TaxID=27933 RepID=UPI0031F69C5B